MNKIPLVPAARSARLRPVLSVILVVAWLGWAMLAWWATPREVGVAQLERDLGAGRVTGYERADGWQDDGAFLGGPMRPRTASRGATLVWTVTSGQTRYVDLWDDGVGPGSRVDRYAGRLAGTAPAGGDSGTLAYRLSATAQLLAVALWLTWLVVLIGGGPPRRGTRWYWFWIGLLPYGVGVLAWLYRERWRPPADLADRHTGWLGFGWGFALGIVLHVVVVGLRELLGGSVVPG